MSCDSCRQILGAYARRHAPGLCPVAKALYCGVCANYGHSPSECVNCFEKDDIALPETIYPVDEIPPENLFKKPYEIADDEECIKATLLCNGGNPMICQEKGKRELREYKENKQRLVELLKEKGYTLILRKCDTSPEENIAAKAKK